jgi:signal peptidase I
MYYNEDKRRESLIQKERTSPNKQAMQNMGRLLRDVLETVLLGLVIYIALRAVIRNFRIEGSSMEPSLHHGQYILISRWNYWLRSPRRGDVIVFKSPNAHSRDLVKRIVGLPGERVEIRNGKIFINGEPLTETYTRPSLQGSASWTLAEDEIIVLGDNRGSSQDSRSWGPLKLDLVVGRGWICYWPPQHWGLISHYYEQR